MGNHSKKQKSDKTAESRTQRAQTPTDEFLGHLEIDPNQPPPVFSREELHLVFGSQQANDPGASAHLANWTPPQGTSNPGTSNGSSGNVAPFPALPVSRPVTISWPKGQRVEPVPCSVAAGSAGVAFGNPDGGATACVNDTSGATSLGGQSGIGSVDITIPGLRRKLVNGPGATRRPFPRKADAFGITHDDGQLFFRPYLWSANSTIKMYKLSVGGKAVYVELDVERDIAHVIRELVRLCVREGITREDMTQLLNEILVTLRQ